MEKKITLDEWLDILATTLEAVFRCLDDDGKISVKDGFTIITTTIRAIIEAYKS